MNQPEYILGNGTRIKTHRQLDGTRGMFIKKWNLKNRRNSRKGVVCGTVPGHGGDVYWVRQGNGIAAYCFTEFELIKAAK